jgi:hypothetical protein
VASDKRVLAALPAFFRAVRGSELEGDKLKEFIGDIWLATQASIPAGGDTFHASRFTPPFLLSAFRVSAFAPSPLRFQHFSFCQSVALGGFAASAAEVQGSGVDVGCWMFHSRFQLFSMSLL